ncbi:MAG: hypothetical protein M3328_08630 [Chloroflexota bacterium]|nr:hypothetical protein [Chloroflexota bacterium]
MTRILYWNINNFSRWKVFDERSDQQLDESRDRENHIVNQVMGQNIPDIFVIVEVYSRVREVGIEGTAMNTDGNAAFGVLLLLEEIRRVHGNQWCLVPPLNLGGGGQREAVAVFYNSNNLRFAGPNIWLNRFQGVGQSMYATPATVGGIFDYPNDWRDGMPNPNNAIPALQQNRASQVPGLAGGGPYMLPEYRLAGRWEYYNGVPGTIPTPFAWPYLGNRIWFPGYDNRGPFLTHFVDLTAANRLIKLFAVHTSPATAVNAVNNLALIPEVNNINANELSVIVGDFNIDTFNANENGAYTGLDNNFAMALDPRDATDTVNQNRHPYCMTHVLPTNQAFPFNNTGGVTDPQHNVYPRFGYMGSMGGQNFQQVVDTGAIDNVFTRYGGGTAVAPGNNYITVVNTIVGKPYNPAAVPAGVTAELTGGRNYPATLANPIPVPGGVNPANGVGLFQNWANFGYIRSTSDHLALLIEV